MSDDGIGLQRVRKQTQQWIEAYQGAGMGDGTGGRVLTNYPNTGKSYGFMNALQAGDDDPRGTILQPNRDLRGETITKGSDEIGLDAEDLPSFPEESPLMDDASAAYRADVEEWYGRGMPPRMIYERLDEDDIPEDDEYRRKMNTELGERELLVGDPVHAHLERAVEGRHVAMDDIDPYSSFVSEFDLTDDRVQDQLTEYVEHHRGFLLRHGADIETLDQVTRPDGAGRDALAALAGEHPSAGDVPDTDHVTAETSRIVRVLAETDDGDRPRAEWREPSGHEGGSGVKYTGARVGDHVIVAGLPLNLRHAETLLMMTATPVLPVFEQVFGDLGLSSRVTDTMTDAQKRAYFDDILGSDVVQTTRSSRFVSGGNNVRQDKFRLTVEEITELHGEAPVVVSSRKALRGELADAVEEYDLETINFARAVGTNEYGDEDLALVWGCPHYGDDYVRRVAAFCGDTDAEPVREDGEATTWSTDASQQIYDNMCEGTVFQAMLRVGRDSDDRATIYVETDKIPDGVPRERPKGRDMFRLFTPAETEVLDAARAMGEFTARELHEATEVSRRTVYDVLAGLADDGVVEEAGTGSHGASVWSLAMECAAEGLLPESVRETLNDVIMQKSHAFETREATLARTEPVLTAPRGLIPPEITPDGPGELQLDLDMFG